MSAFSEERERMEALAFKLASKGVDPEVIAVRVANIAVLSPPPSTKTIKGWLNHPRERARKGPRNAKRVVRYDGRVFESVTKAARSIGVSASGLRSSMQRGTPCRGVRFRFKED